MIVSGHFIRPGYGVVWSLLARQGLLAPVVFYCADLLDWAVFEPIQGFLPPIPVVAKNRSVQRALGRVGVTAARWPVFPQAVIMARHAVHRFPLAAIVKIGLRHGPYHFKRFIRPERYNAFDLFLFTSEHEVRQARAMGITCGVAGGFPKLDRMVHPESRGIAQEVGRRIGLRPGVPTILFTTTWDRSGLSAVERWYRRVGELSGRYNIMVTTHPATSRRFLRAIEPQQNVHLIRELAIWPYLLLADVMVGDTSSILAEFCALDRPMVTFRVPMRGRMTPETEEILERISARIDSFDELPRALELALASPGLHSSERRRYAALMFGELDGRHGLRAARHIARLLRQRGIFSASEAHAFDDAP